VFSTKKCTNESFFLGNHHHLPFHIRMPLLTSMVKKTRQRQQAVADRMKDNYGNILWSLSLQTTTEGSEFCRHTTRLKFLFFFLVLP
jgi:hypothetical protein